jgi:Zn-dependent protease
LILIFTFLYKIFPSNIFVFGLRINLVLAFFNLLPIPPLDGSKILLTKIPLEIYRYLEIYGFIFIIIFVFFLFSYFSNFINLIQNFLLNF